ncbi:unnamed protein product [Adineta steineri]|uniref:SH3 domain-containing protein n=2 Tax=Adineta steineri TaxID=433720 RepID=A0A818YCN6_9BILA|nr:unnamed protein product [Adineta steineri]
MDIEIKNFLLYLIEICLCTTAKRDSLYDDSVRSLTKINERPTAEPYGVIRTDKPKRLMRQASLDESDGEDDTSITEKLRRASSQSPANIPMLVVVSFNPDAKGLQKKQIEIQRGFPVNAQYILNEWLFIKTADDEEGFVPYLCCRPMFRRQLTKCSNNNNNMESSYKPYDFELNKSNRIKSPPINLVTLTPPTNKKTSLSAHLCSPTYLFQKSSPCRKRPDVASSSCGGDSGVSDCESSSNHNPTLDSSTTLTARLSNIRSLRLSSITLKKTGLIVQDIPLKKSFKPNLMKSQLSISSNSAFTQIVKKKQRQESNQRQSINSNNRLFHHEQEIPTPTTTSNRSNFRRLYDSYDETIKLSPPSSSKYLTDNNNNMNSPTNTRQTTPYTRRSLPHHTQSIIKRPLYTKSSSSPDPFKTIKEQQLRNIVLAEPSLPPAIIPSKLKLERHFSDLSLNQIENDSLSPPTSILLVHNHPSLSCSSSTSSSSSSSSAANSSTDDSTTPFIHIQMNNYRAGRIPVIYTSSDINNNNTNANNSNNQPTKSNSFIHNVSITV